MKRMIWFPVVLALLGGWAGFRAWNSASTVMALQSGAAILLGGNLLFMTWLWRRARPDSGDALLLPGIILFAAAVLIGLVPRLLWPAREGLQISASVVSVVLAIVAVVWIRRRSRKKLASRLG